MICNQSVHTFYLFSFIGLLLVTLATEVRGSCPAGWITFETSCYDFVDQRLIWPEASHTCQAMHSDLVAIDDVQEYHFIQQSLMKQHVHDIVAHALLSYWTSGNDIAQEGHWVWGNNGTMTFTYWFPGEPKEHRRSNCMALQSQEAFMFNDDVCDTAKHRFICEINDSGYGTIVG